MTVAEINKKLWPFPGSWNELSTKQALGIMKAICMGYDQYQLYLQFLRILSGCGWYHFLMASTVSKAEQFYLCDFILKEPGPTKNLLPYYRGLYGPSDDFNNLRMNEYAFAQSFYEQYRDNQDSESLNKLVACLYRPQGGNDDMDKREPFTEGAMLERAAMMKHWPLHVKELVFVWYEACLNNLINANADIFNGAGGEPALHGIVSVMRNVAKEGTYGNFSDVERMYVKMLMIELKESKQEAQRAEKQ